MRNTSHFHKQLEQKLYEVFALQPTDLGSRRLTFLYKGITKRLKIMPFLYVIPLVSLFVVASYFILGPWLIKLTTLLQYGF